MRPRVNIAFANFWPGFTPAVFQNLFPYIYEKYDLVLSQRPDVVFYSVFPLDAKIPPGNYRRVFITGENIEPSMTECEFAITFSRLIDHPRHLRLPLWVYENRGWGYGPDRLIKDTAVDWEQVARKKTGFANFVYSNSVPFRNQIFKKFSDYKKVDAAGKCLNNMYGWSVPAVPNRLDGKLQFLSKYKFTLAIENALWPGYQTEKLVDPILAGSVPIYVGDPSAKLHFDPASYVDFTCFASLKEMFEFVRELDNDDALYCKMLSTPFYRNNAVPDFAQDARIAAFFDGIFGSVGQQLQDPY